MMAFAATVRIYKALPGLDFFDATGGGFVSGGEERAVAEVSIAGKPVPVWGRGVSRAVLAARTCSCGGQDQVGFELTKSGTVRAPIAHDLVIQNMSLAV